MPELIEDILTKNLVEWVVLHLNGGFVPLDRVHISNRDLVRKRPCVVFEVIESKRFPAMPNSAAVKLDIHVFSQVKDTPAEDHGAMAREMQDVLADKQTLKSDLNSTTFVLHDLILRGSSTLPDEEQGRESVLTYDAVVSAV